ncbi:MAG TPA: serine hydrolase domain-containing protein [Ignavibacteriaceae bacterium]|nr:serine hydrolase domain-containing protein [Ignavibacteriaceae bacterium]
MKTIIYFMLFFNCCLYTNMIFAQTSSIENKLDNYIKSLPDSFNGTILIAVGDKILINKGYGMADLENDIPNNCNTKYEIGSTTKPFTALLAVKLAEKGLIDLNATIDKYLPDYPKEYASKITIHHLLLHLSGIGQHYNIIPEYFDKQDKLFHTQKEYLQLFWDKPLAHEPGKGMTYSSIGYYLLAVIMERITKKSYAELLQEYIFNPLHMTNSSVWNNLSIIKGKAKGYKLGINGLVNTRQEEESNTLGAAGIVTNTLDLYKFQKIFNYTGDNILSKKYKDLMFKPQYQGFASFSYIGDIYTVSDKNGKQTISILWGNPEGSAYGYRARMTRFIEKDACYIVLSNVQSDRTMYPSDMYNFIEDIIFEYLNMDIHKSKNTDTWDAATYEGAVTSNAYDGFYKIAENNFIQITTDNKKLISRSYQNGYGFDNVSEDELIPEKENVFRVKGREGLRYSFIKDSLYNSYNLIIKNNKSTVTAKYVEKNESQNLTSYAGTFYSVELQKTYNFETKDNRLIADNFLNEDNVVFIPLKKDLFGCDQGYLIFHRYPDETVRDFKFLNESIDAFSGSIFVKEQ